MAAVVFDRNRPDHIAARIHFGLRRSLAHRDVFRRLDGQQTVHTGDGIVFRHILSVALDHDITHRIVHAADLCQASGRRCCEFLSAHKALMGQRRCRQRVGEPACQRRAVVELLAAVRSNRDRALRDLNGDWITDQINVSRLRCLDENRLFPLCGVGHTRRCFTPGCAAIRRIPDRVAGGSRHIGADCKRRSVIDLGAAVGYHRRTADHRGFNGEGSRNECDFIVAVGRIACSQHILIGADTRIRIGSGIGDRAKVTRVDQGSACNAAGKGRIRFMVELFRIGYRDGDQALGDGDGRAGRGRLIVRIFHLHPDSLRLLHVGADGRRPHPCGVVRAVGHRVALRCTGYGDPVGLAVIGRVVIRRRDRAGGLVDRQFAGNDLQRIRINSGAIRHRKISGAQRHRVGSSVSPTGGNTRCIAVRPGQSEKVGLRVARCAVPSIRNGISADAVGVSVVGYGFAVARHRDRNIFHKPRIVSFSFGGGIAERRAVVRQHGSINRNTDIIIPAHKLVAFSRRCSGADGRAHRVDIGVAAQSADRIVSCFYPLFGSHIHDLPFVGLRHRVGKAGIAGLDAVCRYRIAVNWVCGDELAILAVPALKDIAGCRRGLDSHLFIARSEIGLAAVAIMGSVVVFVISISHAGDLHRAAVGRRDVACIRVLLRHKGLSPAPLGHHGQTLVEIGILDRLSAVVLPDHTGDFAGSVPLNLFGQRHIAVIDLEILRRAYTIFPTQYIVARYGVLVRQDHGAKPRCVDFILSVRCDRVAGQLPADKFPAIILPFRRMGDIRRDETVVQRLRALWLEAVDVVVRLTIACLSNHIRQTTVGVIGDGRVLDKDKVQINA